MDELLRKESIIDQYVAEKNISAAVKLLFDLIIIYAKNKDFNKSESLREKLIQIDPMALDEIIRSGGIIEEEKSKSIDKDHMNTWSKLYDSLTSEEANALYFSMIDKTMESRVTVFEQGKKNNNLYFVDRGSLKMICSFKGKEVLAKKLEAGDFAGDDTFFSITAFSSVSLITESNVKLKYLEKSVLKKWDETLPGLNNKFYDYCLKSGLTHEIINEMKINRRVQKRYTIKGKGIFQLMDGFGKTVGSPFKGTLSDISLGGLSFLIRITKKETARLLLGRKLNIKFSVLTEKGQLNVEENGTIIGIHEDALEDYSLNVRFDNILKNEWIDMIEKKSN